MMTTLINPYNYQEYYNNHNVVNYPFIISLDKDVHKYNNAKQILHNLNLNPIKFNAIYGKELKHTHPDIFVKFDNLNDGEIGVLPEPFSYLLFSITTC